MPTISTARATRVTPTQFRNGMPVDPSQSPTTPPGPAFPGNRAVVATCRSTRTQAAVAAAIQPTRRVPNTGQDHGAPVRRSRRTPPARSASGSA